MFRSIVGEPIPSPYFNYCYRTHFRRCFVHQGTRDVGGEGVSESDHADGVLVGAVPQVVSS